MLMHQEYPDIYS